MEQPHLRPISLDHVVSLLEGMSGEGLHSRTLLSLARGALGVIWSASLRIHDIGRGMARALHQTDKHTIKEVDRMLSKGVSAWEFFAYWVPFIVAARDDVVVALDWTDFDDDGQTVIALNLVTRHGRATPLMWKTVHKDELKDQRNTFEDELLLRFKEVLPKGVRVTVLADRGFGDSALYAFLEELGFDFIIRFRGTILVEDEHGESRPAKEWLGPGVRPKSIPNARVTTARQPVARVICVQAAGMKDAWFLATSVKSGQPGDVVRLYGRRFTIEENFRDTKDNLFGMGLSATHIGRADRRDRILLLAALATVFLTLLGAAGEAIGMDRQFKANTSKTRTYSLFRQGCMYFEALGTMRPQRATPLLEAFGRQLQQHQVLTEVLGVL